LVLRRGAVEARLESSKETDDRGIGLSEVAVFLLKVIEPGVLEQDNRPAKETFDRVETRKRISRAGGPLSTASRFLSNGCISSLPDGFPGEGRGLATPASERSEVESQLGEQTLMSSDRIPMSKEGYEKLKAQLDRMKHDDMPRIAEQIAQARGFGDLSENAEFDAAVEAQGMLQARINDLQNKLSQALIVDKSSIPTDRVVYGSKVRVLDLVLDEEEDFILVGPGEEDYDQNKILLTSPIGQGLVGKKIGEEVEVQIPAGVLKLKIVEIGVS
jgi:transcription elongation factor GreA